MKHNISDALIKFNLNLKFMCCKTHSILLFYYRLDRYDFVDILFLAIL